jgi:nucleoid-associated protein YgaU
MTLYKDSRYADSNTRDSILIRADGARIRTLLRYPSTTGVLEIKYYVWKRGDRLDRIAAAYLGSPSLYYKILDLNPDIIDGNQIEPGTRVRLP